MNGNTRKSGFPTEIEAPARISISDTYREICQEAYYIDSARGEQELLENFRSRLHEKIRQAFGIDMAAQSPIDIYPVLKPDLLNPSCRKVDFVVGPRRSENICVTIDME